MRRIRHRDLDRMVVVVTGASSGIGRATCLQLAERGAHVVAVARRRAALDELAASAVALTGRIEPAPADVTDAAALREIADRTVERHGRVDGWVNNAGVNLYGPVEAPPLRDTARLVETNLGGCLHGITAVLPHLREQGRGTIVNVSSVLGFAPSPYQAAYVATKHAIHGLTGAVRQEVARDGIDVCEVAPGPVDTPLFAQAANHMGRDVTPPATPASAERIARAIVATLARPRPTRVVGASNRLAVVAARLAPRLTERASRRMTDREHFGHAPVAATSGNLHEPDGRPATVGGGWTDRAAVAAPVVLAGACLLASLVSARRRGPTA